MKKILAMFFIGVLTTPLWSKPLIVTSTPFLAEIVQSMVGQDADVYSLLQAGSDIHQVQLSPNHIKKIHQSNILISHGLDLEPWLNSSIKKYQGQHIIASNGIHPIDTHHEYDHDHEHHHAHDPHAWQSPKSAKQYILNIQKGLKKAYPSQYLMYEKRGKDYQQRILMLDQENQAMAQKLKNHKPALVPHQAFSYLARDYGFKFLAIASINNGSVSAKHQSNLEKRIRMEGIKTSFGEYGRVNTSIIQMSKAFKLHYLGELISDLPPKDMTYLQMLEHNIKMIKRMIN